MPVFQLSEQPIFPPLAWAEADGLLGVGGQLSPPWLIAAYASGIFPWYSDGQPLLWWSPDPRLVLRPKDLHLSRSLRKTLRQQIFTFTFDCAFSQVIQNCSQVRQTKGTWITEDMQRAYIALHQEGYAHSVEAWLLEEDQPVLAGGLYGVSLGKCFFGESMFHHYSDASKAAFATLVTRLHAEGFHLIDCQMTTSHLLRFGAQEMPRQQFLQELQNALAQTPPSPESWR